MTTTTSRRAILAGAVALPAIAVPRLAISAGTQPDPIFAAIERHKTTYITWTETGKIQSETKCSDEERYWEAQVRCRWASRASMRAGFALTNIQPTTMAGVLALLQYVEEFNAGGFGHPSDDGWRSWPAGWPAADGDPDVDLFGFLMLANVRRALEALAVQS